jgi:hypothetical protein
MRIEQTKENRRKIERRTDDWKPMRGMDRRFYRKRYFRGVEQRIEIRKGLSERIKLTYSLPERRNESRRKANERRGEVYYNTERRERDRRVTNDRRGGL